MSRSEPLLRLASEGDSPVVGVGRYAFYREIAAGGMATVHFGRLIGPAGFSRTVAIKRLYPQLARDPEFVSMFVDEMRLTAQISHANVVATLDVIEEDGELFLVMEYVHGESLAQLIRLARSRGQYVPPPIAASIVAGVLHGLHAAHEARSDAGRPLGIVHRDVSPQNVLVGADGVARVFDFGIATATAMRRQSITREGQLKGKTPYLAPERIYGAECDRRSDVYGAAIVLWEALAGIRLFEGENDPIVLSKVLSSAVSPPSAFASGAPPALDAIALRGLDRDPARRYATARDMALDLQDRVGLVPPSEIGDWVARVAEGPLARRERYLAELDGLLQSGESLRRLEPPVLAAVPRPEEPPLTPEPAAPAPPVPPPRVDAEAATRRVSVSSLASLLGASPEPVRSASRRTKVAASAVALLAVFAAGTAGFANRPSAAGATAPAPPDVPAEAAAVARAGVAVPDAPEPTVTPVLAAPAAPPLSSPPPRIAKAPKRLAPPPSIPVATRPAAAPARAARDQCKPPYSFDASGIKHFKRECLINERR